MGNPWFLHGAPSEKVPEKVHERTTGAPATAESRLIHMSRTVWARTGKVAARRDRRPQSYHARRSPVRFRSTIAARSSPPIARPQSSTASTRSKPQRSVLDVEDFAQIGVWIRIIRKRRREAAGASTAHGDTSAAPRRVDDLRTGGYAGAFTLVGSTRVSDVAPMNYATELLAQYRWSFSAMFDCSDWTLNAHGGPRHVPPRVFGLWLGCPPE